jgi:putative ATPase
MKELGYHQGYQYAHDRPAAVVTQTHLPEPIKNRQFYRPKPSGYEKTITERLAYWAALRAGAVTSQD